MDETYDLDGTRTPQALFDALNAKYKFAWDLFASDNNTKVPGSYFHQGWDAFGTPVCDQQWPRLVDTRAKTGGGWCWANPPYSRGYLARFVAKTVEQVRLGSAVVALIPATPGTQWFNDGILRCCDTLEGYTVDEGPVSGYCLSMSGVGYRQKVIWLRGRVPFDPPIGWPTDKGWSPPATDSILWKVRPPLR